MDPRTIISNPVYEKPQAPDTSSDSENQGTILYANKFSGISTVDMPDDILALLDNFSLGLAGTKNILVQLEKIFEHYPDGPWFVDSINGVIYIHNHRKVAVADYDYYYYQEEGEVLSVSISTNWVTKRVGGGMVSTGINPRGELEAETIEIQDSPDDRPKFGLVLEKEKPYLQPHYPLFMGTGVFVSNTPSAPKPNKKSSVPFKASNDPEKKVTSTEYKKYIGRETDEAFILKQQAASSDALEGQDEARVFLKGVQAGLNNYYKKEEWKRLVTQGTPKDIEDFLTRQLPAYYRESGTTGAQTMKTLVIKEPNFDNASGSQKIEYYGAGASSIAASVAAGWVGAKVGATVGSAAGPWGTVIGGAAGGIIGSTSAALGMETSVINIQDKINGDVLTQTVEETRKRIQANPNLEYGYKRRNADGSYTIYYFDRKGGEQTYNLVSLYRSLIKSTKAGKNGNGLKDIAQLAVHNRTGASNKGMAIKEKQIEMQLRVIGRPTLQSSQILYIGNIGNKWSGFWYVKTCIHQLDSNGYTCSLTLSKGPASKANTQASGIVQSTNTEVSQGGKPMRFVVNGRTIDATISLDEMAWLNTIAQREEAIKKKDKLTDKDKEYLELQKRKRDLWVHAKVDRLKRGDTSSTVTVTPKSKPASISDNETYVDSYQIKFSRDEYLNEFRLIKDKEKK